MRKKSILTAWLLLFIPCMIFSQDIDALLEEATGSSTVYTLATFKSTRIVSGHSIERMPEGQMDFRISHRFGPLNSGAYNLWGMDQAGMRLALEYGITDWLMAGLGRSTYLKSYDGFLKFSILRQSRGERNMPFSLSYLMGMAINTLRWEQDEPLLFWYRVSYVHQLMIGRKFSERLSLQLSPTLIHNNLVPTGNDPNDIWALGIGGRFKLTSRISVNAEYYYRFNKMQDPATYNPLSVGFDIETGGHVFQLHFTNSSAMFEKGFIGETTENWLDGGIRFGFNISRVFTLY